MAKAAPFTKGSKAAFGGGISDNDTDDNKRVFPGKAAPKTVGLPAKKAAKKGRK